MRAAGLVNEMKAGMTSEILLTHGLYCHVKRWLVNGGVYRGALTSAFLLAPIKGIVMIVGSCGLPPASPA